MENDAVTYEEALAFAQTLPKEYIDCRRMLHAWKEYTGRVEKGVIYETLECMRCKTLRKQEMSLRGRVYRTQYSWPKGYQWIEKHGRVGMDAKDAFRVAGIYPQLGMRIPHQRTRQSQRIKVKR